MNIELHVQLTGVLMIILGTLHAVIPRYFRWKVELAPLGLITRQIVYVHTFFIGLVLFLIGTVCFLPVILSTRLSEKKSRLGFLFSGQFGSSFNSSCIHRKHGKEKNSKLQSTY
jgi:hypothetical protein